MQTWIKANIGDLKTRMTNAEIAISGGEPYTNNSDLDERVTGLENAVGVPYTNSNNISTRLTSLESAIGGYTLWVGTKSQYEAITSPDPNTIYFIKADTV